MGSLTRINSQPGRQRRAVAPTSFGRCSAELAALNRVSLGRRSRISRRSLRPRRISESSEPQSETVCGVPHSVVPRTTPGRASYTHSARVHHEGLFTIDGPYLVEGRLVGKPTRGCGQPGCAYILCGRQHHRPRLRLSTASLRLQHGPRGAGAVVARSLPRGVLVEHEGTTRTHRGPA